MIVIILAFVFIIVAVYVSFKIIKKMNKGIYETIQTQSQKETKEKTIEDEFKEFQALKKIATSDDELEKFFELKRRSQYTNDTSDYDEYNHNRNHLLRIRRDYDETNHNRNCLLGLRSASLFDDSD